MKYRQTFVIEYKSYMDAPRVGTREKMMGGELVSVQFSDAIDELALYHEKYGLDLSSEYEYNNCVIIAPTGLTKD